MKEDEKRNPILDNDLFKAFAGASEHVYIYVCDMTTSLSRWSANAVDYFNLPSEYMEHAEDIWMERVHPDDRQIYREDLDRAFSGIQSYHRCEYRAIDKYGRYVWLECRGSVIQDEEGNPKVFAGMLTRLDAKNKYDPLTHLKTIYEFNKNDFTRGSGSLLLIGIDSFRAVINNNGYGFGNQLIVAFCRKMEQICSKEQLLYRMGGDEFIILSPGYDMERTQLLFQQLKKIGENAGRDLGSNISLSISGGVAMYPHDGKERELLISNMEHSLEHAKKFSRGDVVFFSESIAAEHRYNSQLKQVLKKSISSGFHDFQLYFQPIVDIEAYRVRSCEALLRWFHKDFEGVPIGQIIGILEQTGEIKVVGKWIVTEFFKQVKVWQQKYEGMMASVNASYLQFKDPAFVDFLIREAKNYEVDPRLICIELTESWDVDNFESLAFSFRKLREFGFQIALDDFGIAYSTLLLIRNLPVDAVKIDHSFVIDLTEHSSKDLAIIESIIQLCKNLDIKVVVEGVETKETLEVVRKFPITSIQGYYFAKPMSVKDFEAYLSTHLR